MSVVLRYRPVIAALLCCAACAIHAQAQPPSAADDAAPIADPRNLQGMWQAAQSDHAVAAGFKDPAKESKSPSGAFGFGLGNMGKLPLNATAAARSKREVELILKGTPPMNWRVACRPGMPQAMLGDDIGGFEVVQSQDQVLFLFDTDNTYWRVYLDRDHPKNVSPSYLGHSIGRWDANKLVIDTVGYNGRGTVTLGAGPNTQLHTITRIWKENGGKQLKYETYFEDPGNLTGPVTLPVATVNWMPTHRIYEEHCSQSTRMENITDMVFEDFTREEAFPYLVKKKK